MCHADTKKVWILEFLELRIYQVVVIKPYILSTFFVQGLSTVNTFLD